MTRLAIALALILPASCRSLASDPCSGRSLSAVLDSIANGQPDPNRVLDAGACWIDRYSGPETLEVHSLRSALEDQDADRAAPALVECDRQFPEIAE